MERVEIFTNDQLTPIWDKINKKIKKERERYSIVYETIDKYISENISEKKLLIGGSSGVNLLIKKEKSIDDYKYELYSEESFFHANNLSNEIAKNLINDEDPNPMKIVVLRSTIPHMKYQIVVDSRVLVIIFDLGKDRNGVSPVDIIKPVKVDNFDKKNKLLVLSPEMQLIDIYRTLYSPKFAGEWENTLHDENKLFKMLLDNFKSGGVEIKDKKVRENIQNIILNNFVKNNKNCALLGEHAIYMIDSSIFEIKSFVVQIISERDINQDFADICKIIAEKVGADIPVVKYTKNLHIMQDFRLFRTTIKIGDKQSGQQKEIMYIYNSAHYDLIPINRFISGNEFIQIGNPFVLLRFLLIDFWIIRWIYASGGIDESFSNARLASIRDKIIKLRSLLSFGEKDITTIGETHISNDSSTKIFQPNSEEYIGNYENEEISQKEKIKDVQKKYYDYYPQDYYAKNNEYRNIS